jgi:putative transposase
VLCFISEKDPFCRNPWAVTSLHGFFPPSVFYLGYASHDPNARCAISTYAITTVTFQRRALFLRTANAELLVNTIFMYKDQGRFLLHAFAVMPEHLHVLLTPGKGQTVERCVQCIKGGFSFSVRKQFAGEVWQAGFHEHRIRDAEDFRNQIEYVAGNPGRRRLIDYQFVHTNYTGRLDGMPDAMADLGAGMG